MPFNLKKAKLTTYFRPNLVFFNNNTKNNAKFRIEKILFFMKITINCILLK